MAASDGPSHDARGGVHIEPRDYGLNRMFQGLAGQDAEGRVRTFTDKVPATTWLLDANALPEET